MPDISSKEFKDIANTVPGIIYQFSIDEKGQQSFIYVSPVIYKLLGLDPLDVMDDAMVWIKQIHSEDIDSFTQTVGESLSTMEPWFWEGRMIHTDGTVGWFRGESIPAKKDNKVIWSGIVADITRQHNTEKELHRAQHKLEERVKERTAELEVALKQAEVANNAKTDFLSNMSHELRTPLNAISGFGQLLQMSDLPQEEREYSEEILSASDYLLNLIKDILDLNKIEDDQIDYSIEPVSLSRIVTSAIILVENYANKKNISIKNNINAKENIFLSTDEFRCKEIIVNFLSNAIKYNKENGLVSIYADEEDEQIKISISDTGCGIDDSKKEQAFEMFERLGKESSGIEGTGIGLAICKKLAEGLGISIGCQSTVGEGSTFWIKLPRSLTPPAKKTLETEDNNQTEDESFTLLYIEDNLANLKLVQHIIKNHFKIKMLSASTAEQGLKIASQFMPNLILMDINLPDLNGDEALKILQKDKHTKSIPIIALSANALKNDIEHAYKIGFKEYITKPLNISHFITVISSEISKQL